MSEDEAEVKVELEEVDEGETEEVVEAGELLTELRNVFGGLVLTTDVDESRGEVSVNGENWKVEANVDGEMLFKPGGASLRLVRRAENLERVEHEKERISFFFSHGDVTEVISVRRGIEQRFL